MLSLCLTVSSRCKPRLLLHIATLSKATIPKGMWQANLTKTEGHPSSIVTRSFEETSVSCGSKYSKNVANMFRTSTIACNLATLL